MFYTQPTWRTKVAMLSAREDEMAQTAPQGQTPQPKQGTRALATHDSYDAVLTMTSSSDSSPDAKHADQAQPGRDAMAQPMANAPQRNTLAFASAGINTIETSRKKVARKSI